MKKHVIGFGAIAISLLIAGSIFVSCSTDYNKKIDQLEQAVKNNDKKCVDIYNELIADQDKLTEEQIDRIEDLQEGVLRIRDEHFYDLW